MSIQKVTYESINRDKDIKVFCNLNYFSVSNF